MKKALLVALVFAGLASFASAQETYSVNAPAGVVTDITSLVSIQNQRTCERITLASSCTQAQACTQVGAAGGASCTAAQARASNVRIYPATTAGREEWVNQEIVIPDVNDRRATIPGRYNERRIGAWAVATTAQRNAMCAAVNAVDPNVPATVALGCDLSK